MTTSSTLTSLAMLKLHVDAGKGYLEYLRPFVLQVLVDHRPEPIKRENIQELIRTEFGLEIPPRSIEIILKRLSRESLIKKEKELYYIKGELPDPGIPSKKSEAQRHIHAVIAGLMDFSKSTRKPILSKEGAVQAICSFLSELCIPCLRAYLRGTAIPQIKNKNNAHTVLVSRYVIEIKNKNPQQFESFMIMLQGHMLANALLCPDLENAPKSYNGVTFYLDTPLLIQLLGLEGQQKKTAVENLIRFVKKLGGSFAAFSHTKKELEQVIRGVAKHINKPGGRGAIIREAKRNGTTKSDFILLLEQIDEILSNYDIRIEKTPRYDVDLQIDEEIFQQVLEDEVSYYNPRAKDYDINSLRSIYVLRKGSAPTNLEKCRAVMVTSNSGFARAAFKYGQKHEEFREVSPVITDFSLANMAWLKAPMNAPSLPKDEVLAFAYAALQPKKSFWDKLLREIDKIKERGTFPERDLQILRSREAEDELVNLTLGEEAALTEEAIREAVNRVSDEIRKEEYKKYVAEQQAHQKTQTELANKKKKERQLQENLYRRCRRKAKFCSRSLCAIAIIAIVAHVIQRLGLVGESEYSFLSLMFAICSGLFLLLSVAGSFFGMTIMFTYQWLENFFLDRSLKRECDELGLKLEDLKSLSSHEKSK